MSLWFTEKHTENAKFSIKVEEHLYSEKSQYQKIDVFRSKDFGIFFTLDGYMMVNQKDEFIYHEMITHVPMAVNPKINKVLVIGGGDGGTVRELCRYSHIKNIDLVEVDEMVVRVCKIYLQQTAAKLEDKRVNIYFEDGIKFIKDKESQYDLIIVDSTDPIGPGEGLFTKSFYKDCFEALTDDGILINQHESPYYENDAKEMKRAHAKLDSVFPICHVYQFHMPTYPSGHWLFGFASKTLDPVGDLNVSKWEGFNIVTDYYNTALHVGAFALPNYVIKQLNDSSENV